MARNIFYASKKEYSECFRAMTNHANDYPMFAETTATTLSEVSEKYGNEIGHRLAVSFYRSWRQDGLQMPSEISEELAGWYVLEIAEDAIANSRKK